MTEPRRDGSGIGSIVRLLGIGSARVDDASVNAVLPESAEVVFEGVSTDLTASGFRGAQQYRTVSGDMVLDRIAGDVRVRDVSGDVSIRAEEPIAPRDEHRERRRLGDRAPLRRAAPGHGER